MMAEKGNVKVPHANDEDVAGPFLSNLVREEIAVQTVNGQAHGEVKDKEFDKFSTWGGGHFAPPMFGTDKKWNGNRSGE
jgi:hypothetical protein